ncbi:MAG: DUF1569 domain-containing protein [Pseudomonadota bacterium]
MKRRDFISHTLLTSAALANGFAWADMPKVQSLDDALLWLGKIDKAGNARSTGTWPLAAVMEHLAQSVEMSMDGFPKPNSALFQHTAGSAAFAVFKWRGEMSHHLSEPIPGAPVLTQAADWRPASARLRAALSRFMQHQGPLKPHFAYGLLSKDNFARAHVMHIANHQDEILIG